MRYAISFAADTVGRTHIDPFDIEVPDTLMTAAATSDVCRQVRERVVDRLAATPTPGTQPTAEPAIASRTQVMASLYSGEGSVHYGTTTLGAFTIRSVP